MEPEGKARANWGSQLEFILTCVGFAVGLGNVWRFPYLCFKNGGGAFLIPYFICLVFIGIPLFYLELCLGQFASLGPIKVFRINPALKGLGFSMIIVSSLIAIYYAVIIAYCIYFFFASMAAEVPWKYCDNSWNTCACQDGYQTFNFSLMDPRNSSRPDCANFTYSDNKTVSASDEYFNNKVLEISGGLEYPEGIKWELALCNLAVWAIVFIVLSKGIKSLGKVVYFTATFPYILLTILLVRGLTLEGYEEGIKFYLTPDWSKLTQADVWSDAAVQIFYSLSACSGGLIAMASYNKFSNNILRDSFLVPIINCLTSFYAGFVIFAVLGFMAHKKGVSVDKVAAGGPGLAFVVYPEALAQMPVSPLWAILFFFMMMTLGFSSLFSITETVITGLVDEMKDYLMKPKIRLYMFRFGICAFFFLLGLPMVTRGGLYMLNLCDTYVGGFPLLFVGLFELTLVSYIYGFFRFRKDIEMMMGNSLPVQVTFFFFAPTWCVISPVALAVVIVLKAIQYEPTAMGSYMYPDWANALGWMIVLCPLVFIPGWFIYHLLFKDNRGMCSPRPNWGPALDENQTGRYAKPITHAHPQAAYVVDSEKKPYFNQPITNGLENKGYESDLSEPTTKF
ncbi:sodium- and chloride-dependent glycine transporter 2-like [Mytilus trossulus]|uniref:sodium- and chloride-dependent glycine transporter 2-like n=1 Tax=Mytilus trossulus TaxID=6551 RepID=UPI0030079A32